MKILICNDCKIEFEVRKVQPCRDGLYRCKVCIKRRINNKYNKSDKSKICQRRYYLKNIDKIREYEENYRKTEKGKKLRREINRKYKKSPKGKKWWNEYNESEKGKESRRKINKSDIGKARVFIAQTYNRLRTLNYILPSEGRPKAIALMKILLRIRNEQRSCKLCGTEENLQWDHIVPLSKGGDPFSEHNLQRLCKLCNTRKGVKIECLKERNSPT